MIAQALVLIADDDRHVEDAARRKRVELAIDQRPAIDVKHRLWPIDGQPPHAFAVAGGQDDSARRRHDRLLLLRPSVVAQRRFGLYLVSGFLTRRSLGEGGQPDYTVTAGSSGEIFTVRMMCVCTATTMNNAATDPMAQISVSAGISPMSA